MSSYDGCDLGPDRLVEITEHCLGGVKQEIARLKRDRWRPRRGGGPTEWENRPAWWWRFRLVEWAGSSRTAESYGLDTLRGFRLFLRSLDDIEMVTFLEQNGADATYVAESA
jgi:hypothetical protein